MNQSSASSGLRAVLEQDVVKHEGWRLFFQTVIARAYPRVIGQQRVKSWMFFDIFLPILSVSAYVFVYRAIQAGRSLVPLCRGETPADWRKSWYYHYYEFPVPHRVRPHYGVVTDRYKLVHYYKPDVDDWELLDRVQDPLEVKDFSQDPAFAPIVAKLQAELSRLRTEVRDTEPPPPSAYGNP